jgi:hypothetical protein
LAGTAGKQRKMQKIVVHPRNDARGCAFENCLGVYPQGGTCRRLQRGRSRHLAWMRAYEARPNGRSLASKADAIV